MGEDQAGTPEAPRLRDYVARLDRTPAGSYAGLVPADLVLLSGIMGNISASGIERLTEPPEPLVPGQPIFTFYR
jgi:hypothetical protein